ncbi:MAG: hypothetical protein H0W83_16330, partial [Planctomycetes bacterium]|nr:hypothetical protein [Planctomycetota bacterium]
MTKDRSALIEALVPHAAFAPSDPRGETPAALAQRLADSGYLFLRGLVDPSALTAVRADILELCARDGWLDPDAPRSQGVWSGMPFPDHQTYMRLYRDLIRLDSFNRLSATPGLIAALSAILGGPVFAHRRNIARISFPGNAAATTQPHQDHFYIRGTTETYTLWIPTSD